MVTNKEIIETKHAIDNVLAAFKIGHDGITAATGPTVTLFEFKPATGTRISKIANLKNEFAIEIGVPAVRVIAPTPRGTVGIEVPNRDRVTIPMAAMLHTDEYQQTDKALPLCLGRKADCSLFMVDLATMPHLLVAGATGMGKSVCLNAIISSLVNKRTPEEMKMILIDPKQVEFSLYKEISKPYLCTLYEDSEPIITDTNEALRTLSELCGLMDYRYYKLKEHNVRNIAEFNAAMKYSWDRMAYYVVIIDEFADLMLMSRSNKNFLEDCICRLAQKARAVGIHLILSTQRPSTEFVTGCIKANFPARIAFRTTSAIDSRVILGSQGAERLTGRGDFIFSDGGEFVRAQCAYVSTEDVQTLCHDINQEYGRFYTFQYRLAYS